MLPKAGACATIVALAAGTSLADIAYRNDFQLGAGPEWSDRTVDLAPLHGQRILGQFGNQKVRLSLPGVRAGDRVKLSFDFCAIRTWDGDEAPGVPSPDRFSVGVAGGATLLSDTFAVGDVAFANRMSHGADPGGEPNPSRWGAIANDSLGYRWRDIPVDATWRLSFAFIAPGDGLSVWFEGSGLQELSDESWGLDNVEVEAVRIPAPGSLALVGAGALIMCRRRRR